MLGADGLLLLTVTKAPKATNLTARLVAIQPGVVLSTESFSWPLTNMAEWAPAFATQHLAPLLPKLAVLLKDAIPVSIVNLRSAIAIRRGPRDGTAGEVVDSRAFEPGAGGISFWSGSGYGTVGGGKGFEAG